jgi:hypothetical protein
VTRATLARAGCSEYQRMRSLPVSTGPHAPWVAGGPVSGSGHQPEFRA